MKKHKPAVHARSDRQGITKRKKPDAIKGTRFPAPLMLFLCSLALIAVTVLCYRKAGKLDFTNWDDTVYVLENKRVQNLTLENVKSFFTEPTAANIHPLTMLSLSIDYHFTGKKKPGQPDPEPGARLFHLTSLVIYLIDVILAFIFIYLLSRRKLLVAFITALLFAIHPLHVESVAWISERKDVLYGMFFLAALILYVKYLESPRLYYLLLTYLAFVLSILSKPAAIVLPVLLPAIDYLWKKKLSVRSVIEKTPMLLISIAAGIVLILIQTEAISEFRAFTIFQRVLFACYGFMVYLFKLVAPVNLSAFYPYPFLTPAGYLPTGFYLAPFGFLAVTAAALWSARYNRIILFGYLFFLVNVALVLQLVSVGSAIMADRYMFMPSLGFFFIIGYYAGRFMQKGSGIFNKVIRIGIPVLLISYSIFLGILTSKQVLIWKDSISLWSDVISRYPQCQTAYKNRANHYGNKKQLDLAYHDMEILIQLKTKDPVIYSNLGNLYGERNELDKALDAFDQSIALDSSFSNYKAFVNRAITYARKSEYGLALMDFKKALQLGGDTLQVIQNKAYMLLNMKRNTDAISDFTYLIGHYPEYADYYLQRGVAFHQINNFTEAMADYQRCLELNAGNALCNFNLSILYQALNQKQKALQYAETAKSLGHPVSEAYLSMLRE
jgi:tetratricopeptide (TPR) repeat protein